MNYKDKINLFESIELDGIRYIFENPKSYYFQNKVSIEQNINNYYIDLIFDVSGRNTRTHKIIDDVTIKDVKVWLNGDDLAILTDSDLVKLEKILTTKIKEL